MDGVAPGGCRQGDRAARLDPLAGHVEVLQTGQGFGYALDHHRHGLFGEQPAGSSALPVAGVALIAQRGCLVHVLDAAAQAWTPYIQTVQDLLGHLALLAVVISSVRQCTDLYSVQCDPYQAEAERNIFLRD